VSERRLDANWATRTVGDLRAAIAVGDVAKTELQLYGLDWSQLDPEPDDMLLSDAFSRHGAVLGDGRDGLQGNTGAG